MEATKLVRTHHETGKGVDPITSKDTIVMRDWNIRNGIIRGVTKGGVSLTSSFVIYINLQSPLGDLVRTDGGVVYYLPRYMTEH